MTLPDWTRRFPKTALTTFQGGWREVTSWTRRFIGGDVIAPRRVDRWLNGSIRRVFSFLESRLGPITVVAIVLVVVLSITFWDWLTSGESGSTTIRNLGLVVAALVAFPLAVWRSRVADRQASAAQRQVDATQQQLRTAQRQADAAQRQADTAQQNLLNERYQQGAEMLGSDVLAVRLGGIYALQRLAEEHPEQYHVQIMRLFCAFARHPTWNETTEAEQKDFETKLRAKSPQLYPVPPLREDVQAVMTAIGTRREPGLALEIRARFKLDLHDADLCDVTVQNANLSGTNFTKASLSYAYLPGANLSGARFWGADFSDAILSDANLGSANLYRTSLRRTELSGTMLSGPDGQHPVTGLTQAQLDEACAYTNAPPKIEGVLGLKTDTPLVWRGRPLEEDE